MKVLRSEEVRRARASGAAAAAALVVAVGAGTATAEAAGPVRFPLEPWGSDSPAGSCTVCHSLEPGGPFRVAPNLYGIYGAEKARDRTWFGYSTALRRMDGTWTEEDLHSFLEDASQFAPGSTKSIRIRDPKQRQAIIDYLRTLQ